MLQEGELTVQQWNVPVELIHGNFLPRGAESLAEDPGLPSLGHAVPSAYETLGLDLDDFAIDLCLPVARRR